MIEIGLLKSPIRSFTKAELYQIEFIFAFLRCGCFFCGGCAATAFAPQKNKSLRLCRKITQIKNHFDTATLLSCTPFLSQIYRYTHHIRRLNRRIQTHRIEMPVHKTLCRRNQKNTAEL